MINDLETIESSPYIERDLSWLSFNLRVLEEAKDEDVPLYERIKFLAIYSSNLDEFFRVRVANLRNIIKINKKKINKEFDVKPKKLLKNILNEVNSQLNEYGNVLRNQIIPELKKNNIILYQDEFIHNKHKESVTHYFKSRVLSFLQPVILDENLESAPFLENRQLYFALELLESSGENRVVYAYLNIPSNHLDRYIQLPSINNKYYFISIDDIIRVNLNFIFPDHEILGCYSIKLNRDADLQIDDEYSGDLVKKIRKHLMKREIGSPSRFLYDNEMPVEMLKYLAETFELLEEDLVPGGRYHNMNDLISLPNPVHPQLQDPEMPALRKKEVDNRYSIFDAIDENDRLLHFPYQSYDYVLRFFNEAAIDPFVKEIKVAFYRVAQDSFIVNSLISASRNGKSVTVFIEVKARFDEANNLYWADKLESAGVKIIYSIPGLKVHAKVALVKRKYPDGKTSLYGFFGTGNFNEKTASLYADHGLFTTHTGMTRELNQVFNYLYKQKEMKKLKYLLISQFNLQEKFLEMIDREIENVKKGGKGYIMIKVNNLEDKVMIDKLYEASQAGVKIDMIVRSICGIVPGLKDLSNNIRVLRIVDRFLEHARIFIFYNQGKEEIYLGSADWMKRNLYNRIEVVFPLLNPSLKKEIRKLIDLQLKDTVKGRMLDENHNNIFRMSREGKPRIRSQIEFYNWLKESGS